MSGQNHRVGGSLISYPVVIEVVEREIKPRLEYARQALDNTLNGK